MIADKAFTGIHYYYLIFQLIQIKLFKNYEISKNKIFRVLHAPNHKTIKGTKQLVSKLLIKKKENRISISRKKI